MSWIDFHTPLPVFIRYVFVWVTLDAMHFFYTLGIIVCFSLHQNAWKINRVRTLINDKYLVEIVNEEIKMMELDNKLDQKLFLSLKQTVFKTYNIVNLRQEGHQPNLDI